MSSKLKKKSGRKKTIIMDNHSGYHLSPAYAWGLETGQKIGSHSALKGSICRTVMEKDLVWIYGMMCICLKERGWNKDQLRLLIDDIQYKWVHGDTELPNQRMADTIKEECDIDLIQLAEAALSAGEDEWNED